MRRVAASALLLLFAATATACGREAATGPGSSDTTLRLEAVSATELEGTVGESVDSVPTVLVRNDSGQPVRGVRVTFLQSFLSNDPSQWDVVKNRFVTTDSRGIASAGEWKLGTIAGVHRLEASVLGAHLSDADGGAGRALAFNARAKSASAAALSVDFVWDSVALPGEALYPPQVYVKDRFGNYAGGVTVDFSVISGGGSVAKNKVEAPSGFASPEGWTLGPYPGLNAVVASAPGVSPVTFSARALDEGAVTWYDLPQSSNPNIASVSIALCQNGTFELVIVENDAGLPHLWHERWAGKYTVTGTTVLLTYATGAAEQATLADDGLSLVHTMPNWTGAPPLEWNFKRRK